MIATIVLAAGEASRMGQPKQLMKLQGQSLVKRSVLTAQSISESVIVVTGAYPDMIEQELLGFNINTINNENWRSGMGSSICSGLQEVLRINPATEAVIIMLCDQPLVSSTLLQQLTKRYFQSGKNLVACKYGDAMGVPALFSKVLFSDLLALDEREGAKHIIARYANEIASVTFPGGEYDIDTPEDFERMRQFLSDK